jgi:hypothetical protein
MSARLTRLSDFCKIVTGAAPAALASTAGAGDYVSLKGYDGVSIVISVLNGSTVTGGVVVLNQAKTVAAGSAKALSFSRMLANTDCAASDALVETAVTNDTFTTGTTNSKQLLYIIDVPASSLDVANGFDCVNCVSTLMANAVGSMMYYLWTQRYAGSALSAITD